MKIVKKPIVFDAVEFDGDVITLLEVFPDIDLISNINYDMSHYYIQTGDDVVEFYVGDIIVKDINGEYYPVSPDVFSKTYDIVE